MSEEDRKTEGSEEGAAPRASTPFDRPYFMPVLLVLLACWFGYDGWFNEEIESILFNRVVFGLLMLLAIYTTWQDIRDSRRKED